jgi:putative FmdB family regulatory protein
MPTYEYECQKCGRFELFQSIKDEPIKRCPKCKGKVKRLIGTGAGIIFKGSGFYLTDYRSKNYVEGAKKESSGSGGTSGDKPDSVKKDKSDSGGSSGAKPADTKTVSPAKESKKTR